MKRKSLFVNKIIAAAVVLTLMAASVSGCGSGGQTTPESTSGESTADTEQSTPDSSETGDQSESSSKPSGEKKEDTSSNEPTLADKLVGRYSAPTGDDGSTPDEMEYSILEIYKVGENLYGAGGLCYSVDEVKDEPYSYWALEFFPEDPEELMSSTADSCVVGISRFSNQSVAGQYWSSPVKCRMKLTENGISFEGLDGGTQPVMEGPQNGSFERDDKVAENFVYEAKELSKYSKENTPAGLYGVWEQENTDSPVYLDFMDDGDLIRVYQKKAGMPVYYSGGNFFIDDEGGLNMTTSRLGCGDMPSEWNCSGLTLEGDSLSMTLDSWEAPFDAGLETGDVMTFRRTTAEEIPVVMLVRPDDPDVYTLTLTAHSSSGDLLRVIPQFENVEDVENNGGRFVRIGDMIFFRTCDPQGVSLITNWGEFMNATELQAGSKLCYYDRRTGKTGVACEDGAYGPIWYMDGRFYSTVYNGNDQENYTQPVIRYWPNGDAQEITTGEDYCTVMDVSDGNRHIAIRTYDADGCYCTDGNGFVNTYMLPEKGNVTDAFFAGEDLIVITSESYGEQYSVSEMRTDEWDTIELGVLPQSEWGSTGYPSVVQHLVKDGEVYFGVVWYEGTGMFVSDYCVLKAKLGKQLSLQIVESGLPYDPEDGDAWVPKFSIDSAGKPQFSKRVPDGEVILSEGRYGDLVYYEDSINSRVFVKNFIKEYPFDTPDGNSTVILQSAEYVDGAAWVITADGIRRESEDIGWRESYELDGLRWQRIGDDGSTEDLAEFKNSGKKKQAASEPASGTSSVKTAKEAFENVLDLFRKAEAEKLDEESAKAAGLESTLFSYGWPSGYGDDALGYIYKDINSDGQDELIIMLGGELADIYGFNGKEAVHAYGCPYRGIATLYDDGSLMESWGTMKSAANRLYKYNGVVGCMLPIAMESYDPSEKNSSHYYVYGGESSWDQVNAEFNETGSIPEWAFEWDYEADEKEFSGFMTDSAEAVLKDPVPLNG